MTYGSGKYTYKLVDRWAKLPETESILDVRSLSIDSKDKVYVFNGGKRPVMIYDRQGNMLTAWGEGLFDRVHGSCIGPDGSIYCTDHSRHTVSKFSPEGKLLLRLGNEGKPSDSGYTLIKGGTMADAVATIKQGAPPFNNPTSVALSSSGEIYVADGYGNARIHKFSPDGTLLFSWGEPGTNPGQFRVPHCVLLDKHERVWVVDRLNDRIQVFDTKGKFLDQWTDFKDPCAMCMDNDGTVYVAEMKRRVSILSNKGKLLARFSCEEPDKEKALLLAPHAITIDSHGDIYVGDVAMGIAKIDRRGRTVQKFARV